MATYNEIIYNIRNLYRGGLSSDDDTVSDRQILFIFNTHRSSLIYQLKLAGLSYDRQSVQDLGCLELECVDAAECCELVGTGSTLLRTKKKLPAFVEVSGYSAITYVGSVDGERPIQLTTESQNIWSRFNKYTPKRPKAFFKSDSGYLYLTNLPNGMDIINIKGVLSNPEDIKGFIDCDGQDCFNYDFRYPINDSMVAQINDLILQKDMRLLVSTPQDRINDTKPNEDIQAQRRV